jgi:allophanate hydrolase
VPAAFNNLVGFKPSKGRWSTSGIVPACRSLDCVSVFTHDCADTALIDSVLAEFDETDAYARRAPADPAAPIARLGAPKPNQLNFLGDAQAQALFAAAANNAKTLSLELIEIDVAPLLECARLLYQGPWVAERAAAMADILKRAPNAVDPSVRAIAQAGAHMSAIDAFEGLYALQRFMRDAEQLWRQVDALLLPTAPTIYRIAEVRAEPFALNANLGLYTNFVNLLDMAAIAAPAGFRANNTGFGISFIGPAWSDAALLELAAKFHAAQDVAAPALDLSPRAPTIQLAVVGAHLAGMPLHWQLTSRNARLIRAAKTAPEYRLFAMETTPPKPALIHVGNEGGALELEIYELGEAEFGAFTAEVPAPLAIGTVTLDDGSSVKGFVAEPRAAEGAKDITNLGGWRAYIAQRGA